jgi:hypothetical protein
MRRICQACAQPVGEQPPAQVPLSQPVAGQWTAFAPWDPQAPPLFFARTEGSTPFRFSLHVGDVGHTLVVGPTGAGKSVLLALMALQFRRYPHNQIFAFDFGGSIRAPEPSPWAATGMISAATSPTTRRFPCRFSRFRASLMFPSAPGPPIGSSIS